MVDMVVHRHDMRSTLGRLCALLMKQPVMEQDVPEAVDPELESEHSDVVEIIRDTEEGDSVEAKEATGKSSTKTVKKTIVKPVKSKSSKPVTQKTENGDKGKSTP